MKTTTTTPIGQRAVSRYPRYVAPALEIIEMENEGVIASSGSLPPYDEGGDMFPTSMQSNRGVNNYNSASYSDLEDAINDILTFDK